ncbi:HD domain-containing protein [Palleniella muris]|uniref:HD domain-containing protein n=1 Tax=Palleniella muris TaxID=3038145 RepID=A0AC61QPR1_9BACT|nr:HD domain-containing protein [Palleniella muris]TGX81851.1 HD domain-containing protein [Palleniella muris]
MNLEIMNFIETEILPRYNDFDRAHSIRHATNVINKSLTLARNIGADEDMAYVIAAYHDLGLEGPRAIHHITSGKILITDARLRRWFSPEQLKIMKEAVEDHRASASKAPRSIYGKIVAEADRELEPETIMRRTIEYGMDHYPEKTKEEHFERFYKHLDAKYSARGYIHLWIAGSENEQHLKNIRNIIASPTLLRNHFERIYAQILSE